MTDETTPTVTGDAPRALGRTKLLWARLLPDVPILQSGLPASSYAAEQYRRLAVMADQFKATAWQSGQVLAVSSSEPASGKTLTSLNLALALARKGETRVLLVECDLWKPRLRNYLQIDPSVPGIYQVLIGQAHLKDAILSVWGGGLDVIRAGIDGEVENRFADRKMAEILTQLRSRYEFVVLDTPPLLIASGRSLARLAERVLIVVRAGRTRRKGIEEALAGLERDRVLGLLLNDVSEKRLRSTAYSAYSYYGSYGDPDPEEEEEDSRIDLPFSHSGDGGKDRRGSRSRWLRSLLLAALVGIGTLLGLLAWSSRNASTPDPTRPQATAAGQMAVDEHETARQSNDTEEEARTPAGSAGSP